jgi:hypothetical protein
MCSINHDLKAIFIHIPKNGGCYIENILKKYYGFKLDYEIKANNYGFVENGNNPFIPSENYGVLKYYINSETIKNKYDIKDDIWNSYYKFTFVRNPYIKIISAYEYLKEQYNYSSYYKKNEEVDFPSFLDFFENQKTGFDNSLYKNCRELFYYHYYHSFIRQYEHLLNNDGDLNIDYIGRYENINDDLINVLKNLGVQNCYSHIHELFFNDNRINKSEKNEDIDYYYNKQTLEIVNDYFKGDFILFKYDRYNTIMELKKNINLSQEDPQIERKKILDVLINSLLNKDKYADINEEFKNTEDLENSDNHCIVIKNTQNNYHVIEYDLNNKKETLFCL